MRIVEEKASARNLLESELLSVGDGAFPDGLEEYASSSEMALQTQHLDTGRNVLSLEEEKVSTSALIEAYNELSDLRKKLEHRRAEHAALPDCVNDLLTFAAGIQHFLGENEANFKGDSALSTQYENFAAELKGGVMKADQHLLALRNASKKEDLGISCYDMQVDKDNISKKFKQLQSALKTYMDTLTTHIERLEPTQPEQVEQSQHVEAPSQNAKPTNDEDRAEL